MKFIGQPKYVKRLLWVCMCTGLGFTGIAQAQLSEAKIKDVGIGFTLSSGQSFFYMRGTNPYATNQGQYSLGLHIEEQGIALPRQLSTGEIVRNPHQAFYFESNFGWRRLWFKEKMAGGFFPHTSVEVGGVGYFDEGGTLAKYMRDMSLTWAPSLAIGFGGSVFTKNSIMRFEMGHLSTLELGARNDYPHYWGMYLRFSMSNWERPRTGRR